MNLGSETENSIFGFSLEKPVKLSIEEEPSGLNFKVQNYTAKLVGTSSKPPIFTRIIL